MYENFYGFTERPFNLTPDPDFLYLSPIHKKALTYLTYGLETKKGFIQLTGEIGSGKTTILRCLLKTLDKDVKTAYIVNTKGTFVQLLRTILDQLGAASLGSSLSREQLVDSFRRFLEEQIALGCPVILIFDEAQNLDVSTLEEIRMLSNFETEKDKLIQILFVGQPELREKLNRPELEQLRQRITVRCHLTPLSRDETEKYIQHRLNVAGANGSISLHRKAYDHIHGYSGGIPRLVNVVCDAILLAGYVDETKSFHDRMVRDVIAELEEDSFFKSDTLGLSPTGDESAFESNTTGLPMTPASAASGAAGRNEMASSAPSEGKWLRRAVIFLITLATLITFTAIVLGVIYLQRILL